MNQYDDWIGNKDSTQDTIAVSSANSLAATLDRQQCTFLNGEALPPLWQWLYFLPTARQSLLSEDGHPRKGAFLPPIELPRRMWAGSRICFHQPLTIGSESRKTSAIKSIQLKEGRSGKLAFVCVEHQIESESGVAITEEQDIVYKANPSVKAPSSPKIMAPTSQDYSMTVKPDPVLLFRYSALTFNSHRIHYDRDYTTAVEGYPGLVVHGPLLATFLMELVTTQYPNRTVRDFEFKAISPLFDDGVFKVCGLAPDDNGHSELWIGNERGELCVKGAVTFFEDGAD
ncbi:MAG: MaoC family dehydratase N-terminal domain-containing protein [Pseudohongiellaceae bacterium]